MVDNATRTLIFDESGNLGTQGKYFVISCIDTNNSKSLHNMMKKKLKIAKTLFPNIEYDGHEIKACNAYPAVKHHILESIVSKDLTISYIVAEKEHIMPKLFKRKNVCYNYLLKILIDGIITENDKDKKIKLLLDNKTVKVQSRNSFEDYIFIHLNGEKKLNLDLDVKYIDSKSKYGFVVQAADYVANAIYSKYEYNQNYFYNILHPYANVIELFPRDKFQLRKIV